MTQRGKMIIVQLDDGTGVVEMTVFNELFDANRHMFREDELLIATGNARHDTFTGGVRFTAESVMDLAKARSAYASALSIALAPEDSVMERLRTVLTQYRAKPRDAGPAGLGCWCGTATRVPRAKSISARTGAWSPTRRCSASCGSGSATMPWS